jgi:hypothetical protein
MRKEEGGMGWEGRRLKGGTDEGREENATVDMAVVLGSSPSSSSGCNAAKGAVMLGTGEEEAGG